jgi:hypothetical protein
MTARLHVLRVPALALALALAPAGSAAGAASSSEYSRVASAFAASGGHLDPCAFTRAQLEAALAGIPKAVASVVPDLRNAIRDGIAAHEQGACKGRTPTGVAGAAGPGGAGSPPETATPTTPTTPAPTSSVPPLGTTVPGVATTPTQPATTTPATQPAAPPARRHDRTPLVVAAAAVAALLLAALLLWGLARWRGWDPPWAARARHAWGEAGFRTTGTWAEFADWLRLGR